MVEYITTLDIVTFSKIRYILIVKIQSFVLYLVRICPLFKILCVPP
jgi:hypothetical protein